MVTLWLHSELRRAILEGRIRPDTRLPATRDLAKQYGVSRGTMVTVFEQLVLDGYLQSQVGSGTWVNHLLPEHVPGSKKVRSPGPPPPGPLAGLVFRQSPRPFRLHESATAEFPVKVWARVSSRRLRRLSADSSRPETRGVLDLYGRRSPATLRPCVEYDVLRTRSLPVPTGNIELNENMELASPLPSPRSE